MTASSTRRPVARKSRMAAAGAIAVTGALLLSACGDQTEGATSGKQSADSKAPLFDKLPKNIQDAGVVKVGTDAAYAPVEFTKNGKIVGIDPDLGAALGKQLGVKFEFVNGTFDGLITSLQSGRHDLIMSSMSDTKQRQEGQDDKGKKVGEGVDFVDYFTAGTSILVQKGNPKNIKTLDDLCGETVALQRGTTSQEVADAQAAKCKKDDKGKLTVQTFDKDTEALLRVRQGAAAADLNDFPVAAYNAQKSGGKYEVVGEQIDGGPYGIAVDKKNPELRDAVKAAVEAIIKSGEYKKVLEKWDVTDGAVTEATINGGS